jgi:hypothetical protein
MPGLKIKLSELLEINFLKLLLLSALNLLLVMLSTMNLPWFTVTLTTALLAIKQRPSPKLIPSTPHPVTLVVGKLSPLMATVLHQIT